MPILYALVSRDKNVLAEYTSISGNFPTVTRVLLTKIQNSDDCKMSYLYDKHIFHYIVDSGITFLCMTEESMKRRVAFSFLDEVKALWRQDFAAVEQTALAFSLNDRFSPVLRHQMDRFNSEQGGDNISRVKDQLDTVKDVMVQNIDRVLERGEKIELLVDKTDRLSQQAYKFERSSRSLKREMWCRKVKLYALISFIIVVIIIFIAALICGIKFDQCD